MVKTLLYTLDKQCRRVRSQTKLERTTKILVVLKELFYPRNRNKTLGKLFETKDPYIL